MADLDSRAVGNMRQNAQNKEQTKVIRNSNNFPLDYSFPTTHRYGEVDLFYHYYGEAGDVVPLRTGHSVRTYTMSTPNEIDIYMRKQFVHVPYQAIYPRTWNDVLYPLPVDGDVAPVDGRAVFDFKLYVESLVSRINDFSFTNTNLGTFLFYLDALADVVSNGSLLSSLNIHLSDTVISRYIEYEEYISFDKAYSIICSTLSDLLYNSSVVLDNSINPRMIVWFGDSNQNVDNDPLVSSFHQLLEFIRAYGYNIISSRKPSEVGFQFISNFGVDGKLNIDSIIAYQLACAQFYTNDRVDDVFSANTYRQYMQQLFDQSFEVNSQFFEFNGVQYLYDIFSEHNFNLLLDKFSDGNDYAAHAIYQLFHRRYSLRYGDYFLGARTRPLAIGESSIPVVGSSVQVEDITKSAALQRLRYNVNVLGRKIRNQIMGLIPGTRPSSPQDIPTSIAEQDFNIGKDSQEVANTGAAQVSDDNPLAITTHLNSGASDFAFKISLDEPCIILGLVSFAVPRIYSKTVDRFAFHKDRYDMFIPQMQFVGDQEIYRKELFGLSAADGDLAFAYNQRYSEFKQRYSFAAGGFIEFLKSWEMITDNQDGTLTLANRNLSPEFSHSIPSEFNRFYKSLTGYSPADYFHFIVKHYNTSTPERAMAWNPQPLL